MTVFDPDCPITAAEQEMLRHANDVLEESIEVMRAIAEANRTGKPVWRWGKGDAIETLEAAHAMRQFPPSSRPLDRPDDVPPGA